MNLNKQQTILFNNVENILSALVAVNTPEELILSEMTKWKKDFETKVPGARLRVNAGEKPGIGIIDCSRDSAKTSRDSSQYLTLRARIQNTRLTAVVASKDTSSENTVIAEALRELAAIIDRMPTELKDHDSIDLFDVLGIVGSTEIEEDEGDEGDENKSSDQADQESPEVEESVEEAEEAQQAGEAEAADADVTQATEVAEAPEAAEVVTEQETKSGQLDEMASDALVVELVAVGEDYEA